MWTWILFVGATLAASATSGDCPGVLRDNGLSYDNGLSHRSDEGHRRSILDDFTVDDDAGWEVTGVSLLYRWADDIPVGTDLELVFYEDADGAPDFDRQVGVAEDRQYTELIHYPCDFLGCDVSIAIEFAPVSLPPGRYWAEFHVVGPETGYQYVTEGILGASVWVDYEDLGGRQPGRKIFGQDYDVNFVLRHSTGACREDLNNDSFVGTADLLLILQAWGYNSGCGDFNLDGLVDLGDLLAVLAAWGPCE